MNIKFSLTIIMPAYDEADNIEDAYHSVLRILEKARISDYEIIITTGSLRDGSRDNTTNIAEKIAKEYKFTRSLYFDHFVGLGYKYRKVAQSATKEYVMLIPGDGEFIEDSVVDILNYAGDEVTVTYHANPKIREFKRRFVSDGFTVLCNFLFGLKLKYYNGLNILPRKYLLKIPAKCDNFAYMAEILIYLLKSGVCYIEVPWSIKPPIGSSAFNLYSVFGTLGTLASLFWNIHFKKIRIKID